MLIVIVTLCVDLGDTNSGEMQVTKTTKYTRKHATGSGEIVMHRIVVERGMSWKESQEKYTELTGKHEGYYLANQVHFKFHKFKKKFYCVW